MLAPWSVMSIETNASDTHSVDAPIPFNPVPDAEYLQDFSTVFNHVFTKGKNPSEPASLQQNQE